jgi:hypothetical protein
MNLTYIEGGNPNILTFKFQEWLEAHPTARLVHFYPYDRANYFLFWEEGSDDTDALKKENFKLKMELGKLKKQQ